MKKVEILKHYNLDQNNDQIESDVTESEMEDDENTSESESEISTNSSRSSTFPGSSLSCRRAETLTSDQCSLRAVPPE